MIRAGCWPCSHIDSCYALTFLERPAKLRRNLEFGWHHNLPHKLRRRPVPLHHVARGHLCGGLAGLWLKRHVSTLLLGLLAPDLPALVWELRQLGRVFARRLALGSLACNLRAHCGLSA